MSEVRLETGLSLLDRVLGFLGWQYVFILLDFKKDKLIKVRSRRLDTTILPNSRGDYMPILCMHVSRREVMDMRPFQSGVDIPYLDRMNP